MTAQEKLVFADRKQYHDHLISKKQRLGMRWGEKLWCIALHDTGQVCVSKGSPVLGITT